MNVVFFGSTKFVIPIIQKLKENFDLKLVITTEKNNTDAVPKFCIESNIPYFSASTLSDKNIYSEIEKASASVAVLADFGLIIPEKILNAFPKGIINLHPSLLPKYRGPTPVQTAILNGEKETGISIMKLDDQVDHGPILLEEKESISETDTSETLYKKLFDKGANLLPKILNKYLDGSLSPSTQNHEKATFTKRLARDDGFVEMSNIENQKMKIERMIRAYFPWPGVYTKLSIGDKELRIKLLPKKMIQVEGKKPVTYKDFANGYPGFSEKLLEKLEIKL